MDSDGWTPCPHYVNAIGWCPVCVRNAAIEECYIAARGTHLLDKVPAYQQYWRGRAQAADDVRKLKREVPDGQQKASQT